tara:strand:+ start:387 stop:617 length:231 start_codon:yes stop_codon:yes gene_type:complete
MKTNITPLLLSLLDSPTYYSINEITPLLSQIILKGGYHNPKSRVGNRCGDLFKKGLLERIIEDYNGRNVYCYRKKI